MAVPEVWIVQATIVTQDGEWQGMRQVPTFFLRSDVQGIRTRGDAMNVAHRILTHDGAFEATTHITAEPWEG